MWVQRKICIADGDLSDLENLGRLMYEAGFSVSTFQTGQELIRELDKESPFCVVFDANLPDVTPLALLDVLSKRKHYLPVVFIAVNPMVSTIVQAMKGGAVDFLAKPCRDVDLLAAVDDAIRRHARALIDCDAQERIQTRYQTLTEREQEIFRFVVTGMLNKQVASELGISEKTVKVHRGRVMKKLEVKSVAELVRLSEKLSAFAKEPAPVVIPPAERVMQTPSLFETTPGDLRQSA